VSIHDRLDQQYRQLYQQQQHEIAVLKEQVGWPSKDMIIGYGVEQTESSLLWSTLTIFRHGNQVYLVYSSPKQNRVIVMALWR